MEIRSTNTDLLKKRLFAIFLVILLLAVSVISVSTDSARKVAERTHQLVSSDIPEMKAVGMLQSTLNQRVIDLYLYYATMEPYSKLKDDEARKQIERSLAVLETHSLEPIEAEEFLQQVASFDESMLAFDAEMKSGSSRDWDVLREHLAASQAAASQIDNRLQKWNENIRIHAKQASEATQQEVVRQNRFQLAFSLGVLGIAALAMVTLFARLKDQEELYNRAYRDQLTGLPNRRSMQAYWADQFIEVPDITSHSLLLISLDRFQLFTGTFGHLVGDDLLRSASNWLASVLKTSSESTTFFHFAPAAWVILVKENEEQTAGIELAKSLLDLSVTPMTLGDRELSASCSVGISSFPDHGLTLDGLLMNADSALRDAMLNGGSDYRVYQEMMSYEAERSLSIENDLRRALDSDELELYYQPKISSADQSIKGAEALIRWRKNGELIPPDHFIPVAEQTALIIPVGEWVIQEACRQWQEWTLNGYECLPVAVNISSQQFHSPDFPTFVKNSLDKVGMPAHMLELEITEEAATGNLEQVVTTMKSLKDVGVTLAIDDFGTGYSSLSYLKRFPLDVLKIDRSFVWEMESSKGNYAIVAMVVALAHDLNFKIVAEGVETDTQQQLLNDLECDYMQGFHFSRPLHANEYSLLLEHNINSESPTRAYNVKTPV